MPIVNTPTPAATPAPAPPAPAQEPKLQSLKDRLDAAIATEETRQEKLMAEAQQVERRVQMLKAILPFVEDTTAEIALRGLLPLPEPPPVPKLPTKVAPPPPPQFITDRVQVTASSVASGPALGVISSNRVLKTDGIRNRCPLRTITGVVYVSRDPLLASAARRSVGKCEKPCMPVTIS